MWTMIAGARLALLGLLVVCGAGAVAVAEEEEVIDTVEVVLEQQVAGQGEWTRLDVVSVPRFPDGTGRLRTVSGKVDQQVGTEFVKSLVAAGSSGLFRVRGYVAEQGPAGAALTSVPACGLVQSGLKLQLSVGLGGQGDHVDLVEAQLPKAFTSCDAAAVEAASAKLASGGRVLVRVMSLWSTVTQELPLFAANGGSPYLGVKDAGSSAAGGGESSPEAALVNDSEGEGAKKKEAPKSFFQQYWHFIVPAMVLYMLMGSGGEKPGAAAGGAAAGGAGGGGGGGAK